MDTTIYTELRWTEWLHFENQKKLQSKRLIEKNDLQRREQPKRAEQQ